MLFTLLISFVSCFPDFYVGNIKSHILIHAVYCSDKGKGLFLIVLIIIIILIIVKPIINIFNYIVLLQNNKNFGIKRHIFNRLSIIICLRNICSSLR